MNDIFHEHPFVELLLCIIFLDAVGLAERNNLGSLPTGILQPLGETEIGQMTV